MSDLYRVLQTRGTAKHVVAGSRFRTVAIPVQERENAESRIEEVRDWAPKATHHCSAYRLGVRGDTFQFDDDGEPSGTAGRPILREIDARSLTNTLVVVSRHIGGTELGTGGLTRAYGTAAGAALDRASVEEKVLRVPLRIAYDYEDTTPAERVLNQFDAEVQDSTYTDVTTLTVGVRRSEVDAFLEAFANALGGRGTVIHKGE